MLVINGGTAKINAGGKIPYQDVTYPKGAPQLQVQFREIGVNLEIAPQILPDDFVQMNITKLEVIDIARIENLRGVDLPVFSTRSQTGFVYVPNGKTLVIGGLSSRITRRSERRVPVVGKVPLLGMAFRSRNRETDITNLLVFISPTVVDLRNMTPKATGALRFWQERGSEWDNVERIDSEVKAMEYE